MENYREIGIKSLGRRDWKTVRDNYAKKTRTGTEIMNLNELLSVFLFVKRQHSLSSVLILKLFYES